MAEPAWKPPTGWTPDPEDSQESMEESVLQRWVEGPDGRMVLLEFPLTPELFLDPQLEDKMIQGDWHDVTCRDIMTALVSHFRSQPEVLVVHDMKHFLLPRLPAPSPDVSVIRGIRHRRKRSSFVVAEEGVFPTLIIEVVSPGSLRVRQTDLEDKVALYRLAGIPEYLIVDAVRGPDDWSYRLQGYRKQDEGWYHSIELDAEGRFLSETAGLWFQVAPDGQRVLIYEYPSGRRLLNALEQEERAERAEAEAMQAKRKALCEAEARRAAEERLAQLRAEIERLRRG